MKEKTFPLTLLHGMVESQEVMWFLINKEEIKITRKWKEHPPVNIDYYYRESNFVFPFWWIPGSLGGQEAHMLFFQKQEMNTL